MFIWSSEAYGSYVNPVQITEWSRDSLLLLLLLYSLFLHNLSHQSRTCTCLCLMPQFLLCQGARWEKSDAIRWMFNRKLNIKMGFTTQHDALQSLCLETDVKAPCPIVRQILVLVSIYAKIRIIQKMGSMVNFIPTISQHVSVVNCILKYFLAQLLPHSNTSMTVDF